MTLGARTGPAAEAETRRAKATPEDRDPWRDGPQPAAAGGQGGTVPEEFEAAGAEPGPGLFGRLAAALVGISVRRPVLTLILSALLGLASLWVVATRFALDTDVAKLFPPDLAWRQSEQAIAEAFPQFSDRIAVVVDGVTPEVAERAAARLAEALSAMPGRFTAVSRPDADSFFRRNAFLFLDTSEVREATERVIAAQPLLGTLAADPSLRGVARALELAAEGMARGEAGAAEAATLGPAFQALARAAREAAGGRVAPVDWAALFTGRQPDPLSLRRFVLVQPVLDFSALAPGEAATRTIREEAARLGLTPENGVRVRLTGEIVMGDEEFATVFGGAIAENLLSLLSVAALLWMGLRSGRLILPMLGTLLLGLIVTMAFGALAVGPYNPLSIAFAVLFIGLGVDFGIQYAVCLRERRHRLREQPLTEALISAARVAGPGIALAAFALCAGFLAFVPTDYRGVSELGLIASAGMLIAVVISLTTLPAWLVFTRPEEETQPIGYAALVPLDRFLARHARGASLATLLVALAAAATLPFLRFDPNPLNLRDPTTEAVATYRELLSATETTPNTIQLLAPDLASAEALARRIAALPEVADARTLADFVPAEQEAKLALIRDAAELLGPSLEPPLIEIGRAHV